MGKIKKAFKKVIGGITDVHAPPPPAPELEMNLQEEGEVDQEAEESTKVKLKKGKSALKIGKVTTGGSGRNIV